LLSGPEESMATLAAGLGLQYDRCLLSPTILGRPWTANSSYAANRLQGVIAPLRFRFIANPEMMKFAREQGELEDLLAACGYFLSPPYFDRTLPCPDDIPRLHDRMIGRWARDCLTAARSAQPGIVRRVARQIEIL